MFVISVMWGSYEDHCERAVRVSHSQEVANAYVVQARLDDEAVLSRCKAKGAFYQSFITQYPPEKITYPALPRIGRQNVPYSQEQREENLRINQKNNELYLRWVEHTFKPAYLAFMKDTYDCDPEQEARNFNLIHSQGNIPYDYEYRDYSIEEVKVIE